MEPVKVYIVKVTKKLQILLKIRSLNEDVIS